MKTLLITAIAAVTLGGGAYAINLNGSAQNAPAPTPAAKVDSCCAKPREVALPATCAGNRGVCKACTTCSSCKHCSTKGNYCSVCRKKG